MLASKNRISSSCADELRATLSGGVALPGHELYDAGSRVWNGAVRRHPAIVAFCRQPEDVQAAVLAARRHGLPLSVRGGGHDWAGRALRDDAEYVGMSLRIRVPLGINRTPGALGSASTCREPSWQSSQ